MKTDILSIIYDSLVMFVICFVYVVKRLEHSIKMDMALYKSYVLLLSLLLLYPDTMGSGNIVKFNFQNPRKMALTLFQFSPEEIL